MSNSLSETFPGGRFVRAKRIHFSECDPAGIVFYPQYFVMFNDLMEGWVDALGIGFEPLVIGRRIGLPTVRLEADFKAISRMGDAVRLSLGVEHLGTKSLTLSLACHADEGGADGELRMAVKQVIVTTSLQTHQAIAVPEDLREGIGRMRAG